MEAARENRKRRHAWALLGTVGWEGWQRRRRPLLLRFQSTIGGTPAESPLAVPGFRRRQPRYKYGSAQNGQILGRRRREYEPPPPAGGHDTTRPADGSALDAPRAIHTWCAPDGPPLGRRRQMWRARGCRAFRARASARPRYSPEQRAESNDREALPDYSLTGRASEQTASITAGSCLPRAPPRLAATPRLMSTHGSPVLGSFLGDQPTRTVPVRKAGPGRGQQRGQVEAHKRRAHDSSFDQVDSRFVARRACVKGTDPGHGLAAMRDKDRLAATHLGEEGAEAIPRLGDTGSLHIAFIARLNRRFEAKGTMGHTCVRDALAHSARFLNPTVLL